MEKERDQKLTEELITLSSRIGVDTIGFADPEWYNTYKEEHRPTNYLEDAQTVIIIGIYLYDIILDAWSRDQTTGKSFHYLDSVLESRAHKLKDFLSKKGYNSKIISYSPGLFLKDSAALAGLGPIGKNNLFITKKYGSQLRLRAIVTEAPLLTGVPIENSESCNDCNICISKCPAGALTDQGYNRQACESYCLSHLRKLSNYTSIWCNICIEVCPLSKKSEPSNIRGHFD